MGLLSLAAALLVGSAAAARATARAARSNVAALVAEGEARRAAAGWRGMWDRFGPAQEVGALHLADPVRGVGGAGSLPWVTRVALRRVGAQRWLLVVECEVGPDSAVLARRRIALLLERALPDTGAVGRAPLPVRGWALADLY